MKNSYTLNGLVLEVCLKQSNVSLHRCHFWMLSKYLAEWDRRAQMGGRLLDFLLTVVAYAPTTPDLAQYLHMPQNTLVLLTFSARFPQNQKTWVHCSYSVYSVWKLIQLLLQYTVPVSRQLSSDAAAIYHHKLFHIGTNNTHEAIWIQINSKAP